MVINPAPLTQQSPRLCATMKGLDNWECLFENFRKSFVNVIGRRSARKYTITWIDTLDITHSLP